MAVLTSAGRVEQATYPPAFSSNQNVTDNIDDTYGGPWPGDPDNAADFDYFHGSWTDNLPVSQPGNTLTSAGMASVFLPDWYNRIHLIPATLDLGNLLSSQEREVEVWNAYFTAKNLTSVVEDGTQGINITYPVEDPPTQFAALESRILDVSISTNGPPTVNATFTFVFPDESPVLTLTGRRVTIWAFEPERIWDEELEWKTDIISTRLAEQRIALRTAPRQKFNYRYSVDPQRFMKIKAINTLWSHRVYGVPVWEQGRYVGALSAAAPSIAIDTDYADYREGGLLIVWDDDENFEAIEIDTINPTSIVLALPLEGSYTNAFVAPLRLCRTLDGASYSRASNEEIIVGMGFLAGDNLDIGDEGDYDTYLSVPVMTDRTVVVEDINERIIRGVDVIDNGQGAIEVDTQKDYVDFRQMVSLSGRTRDRKWSLRQWLHARRGKQRSFWLPSWNRDLIVAADIGSAATAMTVEYIGYGLYLSDLGSKYIMLVKTDGSVFYNTITSGADNGDGTETLVLSTAFGENIDADDVDFVSFLSHVRLDSDRVILQHGDAGRINFAVPVTEVPV